MADAPKGSFATLLSPPQCHAAFGMMAHNLGLREISHEDGQWMKLAYDHFQWWALVLVMLHLWVLQLHNFK
jgi:hypothetical protein